MAGKASERLKRFIKTVEEFLTGMQKTGTLLEHKIPLLIQHVRSITGGLSPDISLRTAYTSNYIIWRGFITRDPILLT